MGSHTLLLSHFWWQIGLSSSFRSSWRLSIWACGAHSLFGGSLSHYDLHDGWLACRHHLAWRHWTKDVLLSLHLEDIVIRSPVVDDTSIKLPWSPKKKVANEHWNDITLQSVFTSSNLEGNLYPMLDLDSAGAA